MKIYRTADLYVASFLHSKGIHLIRVEREGHKGFFVFAEGAKCEQLVLAYYNAEAECDAREFGRSIKELKSLVANLPTAYMEK